ncbi:2Fe-2S iron-sulfur cluster-binding protein [Ponticoccus litoralis]|uniref:2Fe-2S iron-sulfur cluster-binding protein n=1 Tax=Ponticoccus litoralis TaxID=422297 RepID=A0AAW9SGV7_9RHOB
MTMHTTDLATQQTVPEPLDIRLTVNGSDSAVRVAPRTQLAEILRDELNLTATHLACEQGVCGACTVMVDGRPVRACLTFARDCDGSRVDTLEGWQGDQLMDRLRDAFQRNHALQCGFCTPGMMTTARDLVERLDNADETRIRNELSGNLCRCTGYVGIVGAIREVIEERDAAGIPARPTAPMAPRQAPGFAPFTARPDTTAEVTPAMSGESRVEDGWTVVRRKVVLDHPPEAVWAHFRDLPAVARCLPGADLSETDGERFSGHVGVRFGPISARFEGEGRFAADDATREGKVSEPRQGSRRPVGCRGRTELHGQSRRDGHEIDSRRGLSLSHRGRSRPVQPPRTGQWPRGLHPWGIRGQLQRGPVRRRGAREPGRQLHGRGPVGPQGAVPAPRLMGPPAFGPVTRKRGGLKPPCSVPGRGRHAGRPAPLRQFPHRVGASAPPLRGPPRVRITGQLRPGAAAKAGIAPGSDSASTDRARAAHRHSPRPQ